MEKYLKKLTHCTFSCNDYWAMEKFYTETLELETIFTLDFDQRELDRYREEGFVLDRKPGDRWISYIKITPLEFIELYNVPYHGTNDPKNQEFHHVTLLVEDIFEAAKTLEGKGVQLYKGPHWMNQPYTKPYAEAAEKELCGSYAFFVADPEGNDVELMQYTEDSLQLK